MRTLAYPTACGHWHLQRNALVCRLPRRTVRIRAPGALLGELMALCKGRLAWREVAGQLARRWSPEKVEAFLRELAGEGVLVEPHELEQASVAQPGGRQRGASGARTFSGEAVPLASLSRMLETAHACRPHAAHWWLLVLHAMSTSDSSAQLAPALHACGFDAGGRISFAPATASAGDAWMLLADPRALQFASAVILPIGDPGAQPRATRAALAACLQAAAATAHSLGLACSMRRDVLPGAWSRWAGSSTLVDARDALLVGMPATARQAARERAVRWMHLRAARSSSSEAGTAPSAHACVAGPIRLGPSQVIYANGRSADAREAAVKAEAEAWERLGWATLGATHRGRASEVENTLDPRTVAAYTSAQYGRAGFPWSPYSPRRTYAWCRGVDVESGRPVHLPAECIHALSALPDGLRRGACTSTSTSGTAAWTDPEGALSRAALELVERDAFLRAWISGAPAPCVIASSLPGAALARVRAMEAAGQRVAVLQLPSTLASVLAVFVQSRMRPFTGVAAAADFDAEAALDRALHEAEALVLHAAACPAVPLRRAGDVAGLEDIHRLYQSPRWYRHADFLAAGPAQVRFDGRTPCADDVVFRCKLAQEGRRLLAFDLTPPHASLHQGRTPLHVVRAVIPGLIPIWFRPGLEPAGLAAYRQAAARRPGGTRSSRVIHPFI